MIYAIITIWMGSALIGGSFLGMHLDLDEGWRARKVWAAVIVFSITLPVTIVPLTVYGLCRLVLFLKLGFVDLYRHFFPAKVALPEARTYERK